MSKKITKAGYDEAVNELRELLTNWLESGVELFLKLRDVDMSGIWKLPGHATFADFLRAEFPTALGFERYQNVINAIEIYGVERVKQVGIESCHTLTVKALVENPEKREAVLSNIDIFVDKNGCAPDRNKVRDIVLGIAPEARAPGREMRELTELARLRAETESLRRELRELKKENRALKVECERLQKKLDGKNRPKGSGRRSGAAPSPD